MEYLHSLLPFAEKDVKAGLMLIFLCCVFAITASFFDTWTKIEAVKAQGRKPKSHPLSDTGKKIIDYLRLIAYFLMVDILGLCCFDFYHLPYCVVVITLGILFREGLSMKENYELKKSSAVEVINLAEKIVQCVTPEEADELIATIRQFKDKQK